MLYDTCEHLNDLVDVISLYISFCVDSVIPTKQITVFSNNKSWITKDLKAVLNKKKRVFFQGTTEEKKQVNKEVKAAIRQAKQLYKQTVELKFIGGNFRDAWKGIKNMAAVNMMTDPFRSKVRLQGVGGESLPEMFNDFFTRFEEHNFSSYMSDLKSSLTFD